MYKEIIEIPSCFPAHSRFFVTYEQWADICNFISMSLHMIRDVCFYLDRLNDILDRHDIVKGISCLEWAQRVEIYKDVLEYLEKIIDGIIHEPQKSQSENEEYSFLKPQGDSVYDFLMDNGGCENQILEIKNWTLN
ncbi:hypothetical protein [Oceanobacter sp. 4_MG-2023]|uniref:hypothetical protein n=1 Tax=Oceanobacter sp. 4_MG-2023 TaxID=3062623 RepID=UPI002732E0DA|nr:hypothetical protein [Oceanobacter sp. 4_MG-2023]MDP2548066.1 hypothetical protein [Oceanobacter sp. 4_MG-2023]